MNKYSIITIIAIIVIAAPVAYGIWSAISVEKLEFRSPKEVFRFFEMASDENIEICNPNPFFVTFNGIKITVYYLNQVKGVFELGPTTIGPVTDEVLDIDFSSDTFSEAQYLFMHMDGQFTGEQIIRIDPRQMMVETTFDTKIIGIIPYQSTITQSGFEFSQMMNQESSCKISN